MPIAFNIFSLTLLISGVGTLVMALLIFRRLGGIVRWFGTVMMLVALWAFFYGLELSSLHMKDMMFWLYFEYIGISFLPAIFIIFIIKFIGHDNWLHKTNLAIIFSVPVLTLLLMRTNNWHHLYYTSVVVDSSGPFPLLDVTPGIWYYVHTAYFYITLAIGMYLLISKFRKADAIYRRQNRSIIIAAIIPWSVHLLYMMDLRPLRHIDLTPYAFIITTCSIGFGLLRLKLFDIIPVARELIVEQMGEGVLVLDTQDRVIDSNPAMSRILPHYGKKIIGLQLDTLFPGDIDLHLLVKSRVNSTIEVTIRQPGTSEYYEVATTSLFEKDTVYSGIILLFRNITERKLANEKLKLQSEELLALNKLKDRLFSIVSHDMRSPLMNLKEIITLTNEGSLTEAEFKSFLPTLARNIEHTSGLLENILYWSMNQLKGEVLNPQQFDLHITSNDKLELFRRIASEKGIRVENNIPENTLVYADQNMIDLVLRNLIANSIKFCRKDDLITLTANKHTGYIKVCVADTGVGISEANKARLFGSETFSTKGTGNEQGTGLGLMLCKEFVEKNRGTISIESTQGVGSCFCFTLPTHKQE